MSPQDDFLALHRSVLVLEEALVEAMNAVGSVVNLHNSLEPPATPEQTAELSEWLDEQMAHIEDIQQRLNDLRRQVRQRMNLPAAED